MSNSRCRYSIHKDPLPTNPVIIAAGFADTVTVNHIDYVARRIDYDAEECIQKALDDGEVEEYYPSRHGDRGLDSYRLTAKGRKAADRYLRKVFQRSGRKGGQEYKEGDGARAKAATSYAQSTQL